MVMPSRTPYGSAKVDFFPARALSVMLSAAPSAKRTESRALPPSALYRHISPMLTGSTSNGFPRLLRTATAVSPSDTLANVVKFGVGAGVGAGVGVGGTNAR